MMLKSNAVQYQIAIDHQYWLTSDGTKEAILSGQSHLDDAVSSIENIKLAIDQFTWSEGLALASMDLANDYQLTGNTATVTTNG